MQKFLGLSYLGSISALATASCCVLPKMLMVLGLGGSWLAVFGKIAAASYYVLAISTALVVASWTVMLRRGSFGKVKWWWAGSTTITALAWVVLLNGTRINDYMATQM